MIDDIDLSFSLIRQNRKTLTINLNEDGRVIVKSPLFVPLSEIKKFIAKHTDWILSKRARLSLSVNLRKEEYRNGCELLYLGKKYSFSLNQGLLDEVVVCDNLLNVYSTKPKNETHTNRIVEKWYLAQAQKMFDDRLRECIKKFPELKIPDITIKSMKSRWGSYSSMHKITLNLKLIKMPVRCIDYVIIHELCHAYHMNHSKEFKKLLGIKLPEWKMVKRELNCELHFI